MVGGVIVDGSPMLPGRFDHAHKILHGRRVSVQSIGNMRATPEFSRDHGRCVRKGDVLFKVTKFHFATGRTARGGVSLRDT